MAPPTFMRAFVAALGDKGASLLGSIGRPTLISVFGALLFRFVLQVPMRVLKFLGWSLL